MTISMEFTESELREMAEALAAERERGGVYKADPLEEKLYAAIYRMRQVQR